MIDLENIMINILKPDCYLDSEIELYKNKYQNELNFFEKKILLMKQFNTVNYFHGVAHSHRVCLFAYILGIDANLNEIDIQILIDAALYHDCGKKSDYEDSYHGVTSALEIDKYIDSDIYFDSNNLDILKAVVANHSTNDSFNRATYYTYVDAKHDSQEKYERYLKLSNILKDSDALDRTRFKNDASSGLNPEYLRNSKAKEMIVLATKINCVYEELIFKNSEKNFCLDESNCNNGCFHSIGFDFFKINSILKNGILSSSEMKKRNIKVTRNFQGGNMENWISVVDDSKLSESAYIYESCNNLCHNKDTKTAYGNFTSCGIGFYCFAPKLYKAENDFGKAYLNGLPFNKSHYIDERYVYKKISPENIKYVIIHNDYVKEDISKLTYLYNTLDITTLKNRVAYYLLLTENSIKKFDEDLLNYITEYDNSLKIYLSLEKDKRSSNRNITINALTIILNKINKIIADKINNYFKLKLGKDNNEVVTTCDVLKYCLEKYDVDFNVVSNNRELIIDVSNGYKLENNGKSK